MKTSGSSVGHTTGPVLPVPGVRQWCPVNGALRVHARRQSTIRDPMTPDTSLASRQDDRGTVLIVAATAVGAVTVLGFQVVASRSLGSEGFAPIAVLWTLMFLIYTVFILPAEQHLTRALVVTRTSSQVRKVHREMGVAFLVALLASVLFVGATLDRFFGGAHVFILIAAAIVGSRSAMATTRGTLAGKRRFASYGVSIGLEAGALLMGGIAVAASGGGPVAFGFVIAFAPLATLLAWRFGTASATDPAGRDAAQPGTFLTWLVVATAASQVILAGGPIAVGIIGGDAVAVSVFFISFALLRGPITSAYSLVARALPDFTNLATSRDPWRLWCWGPKLVVAGSSAAVVGALASSVALRPIVELVYGAEYSPPTVAALFGGAGVGFGLGALFATQLYSAAAAGARLAIGWTVALIAGLAIVVLVNIEPITRVALGFAVGEATGLVMLGLVLVRRERPSVASIEARPS